MMSQSSESVRDGELQHTPFDMEIEMTEQEMQGLRDAFHKYMDNKDQKINFNELLEDLRKIDIRTKQPLLYEILERISYCDEIQGEGNDRIDFQTFIRLIKESLN